MKVYIAGKITGAPYHEVESKFATAADRLDRMGYDVVNPCELVADPHTPWTDAMKTCIRALSECDVIHLLPDWPQSPGACLELDLAYALKLKIQFDMDKYKVVSIMELKPGDRFYKIGDGKKVIHQVVTRDIPKKASHEWVKRDDQIHPFLINKDIKVVFIRSADLDQAAKE